MGNLLFLGGQENIHYDYYADEYYGVLYKSLNNGESWERVQVPFVRYDMAINSLLSNDSILIAGGQQAIYRSTDNGLNWEVVVNTMGANALLLHNDTVLASSIGGLLRSTNFGETWFTLPEYYEGWFVHGGLIQNNLDLYNIWFNIHKSTDGGISWRQVFPGLPSLNTLRSLVFKDSIVLTCDDHSGILRSTDNGITWNQANKGLISSSAYHLYAEDSLLLATTVFPTSTWGNFFRSTDDGTI